MPLPEPPPTPVQAPARAGIGIGPLPRLPRTAEPQWPEDWWQRDLDVERDDPDAPDPTPLTERQMRVPPPPAP